MAKIDQELEDLCRQSKPPIHFLNRWFGDFQAIYGPDYTLFDVKSAPHRHPFDLRGIRGMVALVNPLARKVMETFLMHQNVRNGHVYIRVMKQHIPSNAPFLGKLRKTDFCHRE